MTTINRADAPSAGYFHNADNPIVTIEGTKRLAFWRVDGTPSEMVEEATMTTWTPEPWRDEVEGYALYTKDEVVLFSADEADDVEELYF